jgi:hypothetical protein
MQPLKRDSVLRIETFGLGPTPGAIRDVVDDAVGENAIDVHEQEADARRTL